MANTEKPKKEITEDEKQFCEFLMDACNALSYMIKEERTKKKEDLYLCRKDDGKIYFIDSYNQIEVELTSLDKQNKVPFAFIKENESYRIKDLVNYKVKQNDKR